jgi:hypothetical protein
MDDRTWEKRVSFRLKKIVIFTFSPLLFPIQLQLKKNGEFPAAHGRQLPGEHILFDLHTAEKVLRSSDGHRRIFTLIPAFLPLRVDLLAVPKAI